MACAHSEAWPQDNRRRAGSESQVMAGSIKTDQNSVCLNIAGDGSRTQDAMLL